MDESNVTQIVSIASGSAQDNIQYNTTVLNVATGSCVKFIFINLDPDIIRSVQQVIQTIQLMMLTLTMLRLMQSVWK